MATSPPNLERLGRYDIESELGKGAMGVVYAGNDSRLKRKVAIKTILKSALDEDTAKEYSMRFDREARAVARLNHPNIVQVYDFGEEGDIAYIVMEFIKGRELKDFFDAKENFPLKEAVHIMCELCDALHFAHEAGIVHRDIKPANVMIDSNGRVKLADFGVARITDADRNASEKTAVGVVIGTPAYMSPEQIEGAEVDRRSDIFSAGVVLYQFLTGEKPFTGTGTWTIAKKILHDDPPRPSSIHTTLSPLFDAVVNKALAKKVENRYQTARDLENALKNALEGKGEADEEKTIVGGFAPSAAEMAAAPAAAPKVATPAVDTTAQRQAQETAAQETDLEFWRAIKDGNDPDDFDLYIQQFPKGIYTALAKRKSAKLRGVTADETVSRDKAAQEQERREIEEAARREAEAKAKLAEERAKLEEEIARREAEYKQRMEEAEAKREAEAKARAEAEAKSKAEFEAALAKREADFQARAAEAEAKREAEEKQRQAEFQKRAAEIEAKREAEEKQRQAEFQKRAAEIEAKREAEEKRRQEEEKKRQEEDKARAAAEAKKKAEFEAAVAKREAELKKREAEGGRKITPAMIAGVVALVVAIGVGVYFMRPDSSAREAELIKMLEEAKKANAELTQAKAREQELQQALEQARAAEAAAKASGDVKKQRELAEQTRLREAEAQKQAELIKQREVEAQKQAELNKKRREELEKLADARKAEDAKKKAEAAQKAAAGKSAAQKAAAQKAAAEQAAAEKAAAEKAATEQAAAERAAAEKAAAEKAAAAQAAAQKAAAAKAAAQKAAADTAAAEKLAAEKAAAERAAAEKLAAEKAAAEKPAAEKAAASKAKPAEEKTEVASLATKSLFQQGQDVEAGGDVRAAVKLYTRAARAGDGQAAKVLGDIFSSGRGNVQRDYVASLRWYKIAEKAGVKVERAGAR